MATDLDRFSRHVENFKDLGKKTRTSLVSIATTNGALNLPCMTNEFWTARQRAAHSLHEISYRACFKPQLPRFFIERLTKPGGRVYDPFMGRGTTLIEAALLNRVPAGCDINPLSRVLVSPRLNPPPLAEVERRLHSLDWSSADKHLRELLVFYHPSTLRQLLALRSYLLDREQAGTLDDIDRWIRMVAVNRLTGHSSGFFSVYTMPPNQAVSSAAQAKINQRRQQVPEARDVARLILKKSRSLLKNLTPKEHRRLKSLAQAGDLLTAAASDTPFLADNSIDLVVTSPPFLDVINYAADNWLRCWFCGINPEQVELTVLNKLSEWQAAIMGVFHELHRVLRPGGKIAFEVGEVRSGRLRLEEAVVPCGLAAGLIPKLIMINQQQFSKTANCWGISNNSKGTNSNRIVLLSKPE